MFIKNKRAYLALAGSFLFLILALRSTSLGYDLNNYEMYYYTWGKHSLSELISGTKFFAGHAFEWGLESGYVWFNWICYTLGMDFHQFLIFHSLICAISITFFLTNYRGNLDLAFAMILGFGVFKALFYLLRLTLALAAALYSVKYLKDQKVILFILWICVATFFHRSALILVLLYPASKIRISFNRVILIGCVGLLGVFLVPAIYSSVVIPILGFVGKDKLYPLLPSPDINAVVFVVFFLLLLLSWIIMIHGHSDWIDKVGAGAGILALGIEVMSIYQPVLSRIALVLLFPFFFPAISEAINKLDRANNRRIIKFFVWVISIVFFVYGIKQSAIYPYKLFY